jgi:predicted P-loop ATPase
MVDVISLDEHKRNMWQDLCLKSDKKKIIANHANAMIALRNAHDIRDVYAYDEMLRAAVMLYEIGKPDEVDRWVGEADVCNLLEWFHQNGMPGMRLETVRSAMNTRANENKFHPVANYLESVVWDQVPRIGTWLSVYLGAPINDYTKHIGRMFLTSMVARIARPGCQADHMVVLEGAQGIMKSSACRVLGGRWFSDAMPEISDGVRASQHLRDKWLVEVSEMHAMNKAEAALLKSFISRTTERYRPSYARLEVHEPRQCVFVGTTNMDAYLRDPTGGRRFWPVRTGVAGKIDLEWLERDRDLLFAEAVQNFRDGHQWWPDQSFENEMIRPEQAERYQGDIWEDKINEYCETLSKVTVHDLAKTCLGFQDKDLRQEHAQRIAAILRDIGWTAKRNGRQRFWTRP